MAELLLQKEFRLDLKARAHALDPVVLLGAAGLTEPVFAEVDRALNAHSLIKVRVPADDRDAREAIFADLANRLGAARVQAIGKIVVLYRPPPVQEEPEPPPPPRRPGKQRRAPVAKAKPRRRGRQT